MWLVTLKGGVHDDYAHQFCRIIRGGCTRIFSSALRGVAIQVGPPRDTTLIPRLVSCRVPCSSRRRSWLPCYPSTATGSCAWSRTSR